MENFVIVLWNGDFGYNPERRAEVQLLDSLVNILQSAYTYDRYAAYMTETYSQAFGQPPAPPPHCICTRGGAVDIVLELSSPTLNYGSFKAKYDYARAVLVYLTGQNINPPGGLVTNLP